MHRTLLPSLAALLVAPLSQAQELFSLDFPGGPMSAYVEAIQDANPEADILVDDKITLFPIARTILTNVDLRASLDLYSGSRIATPDGVMELYVRATPIANTGDHVVRLMVEPVGRDNLTSEARVWSLQDLASLGMPIADALSAIETAITVGSGEAVMKYHEQTSLLIVSGSGQSLHLVNSTIETLTYNASSREERSRRSANEITELEFRLAEAEADMRLAAMRLDISQNRLEAARKEIEEGVLPQGVMPDVELEVAQAERDLFVSQKRVEMFRDQLRGLHEGR
ncbi:MAG: hypothetical protein ACYTF7_09855 [Planctomycetota bacterium]|jgi:hypothetical protein